MLKMILDRESRFICCCTEAQPRRVVATSLGDGLLWKEPPLHSHGRHLVRQIPTTGLEFATRAQRPRWLTPRNSRRLTNDGNAILREIEVAHPAAKSMIELSRTQDEEVGDGTTSVIILGLSNLPSRRAVAQGGHWS